MAVKMTRMTLTGNQAVALAMKQINPDVVAAYPITPQTEVVQTFSEYVANGEVVTEFVTAESEHSAMSAAIGAAAAGARAMTATSSQGLALMWEMLYIASSYRLPIVMPVVNRALSGPINIHCDHSDAMGARDAGWIQLYSENPQEAYDNLIQAVRIAEDRRVLLPVMVCQDGFITSHGLENLEVLDDAVVREFLGEYRAAITLLDKDRPITMGPLALQDYYFEFKVQQAEAMRRAPEVIEEVGQAFGQLSSRQYGFFETYQLEDAEAAIVALGSTAGTARVAVDRLRRDGLKVGLLKLRVFRPFPATRLVEVLTGKAVVAVLDRAESLSGMGGPVFTEFRSAFYDLSSRPLFVNYIYGLGGRDIGLDEFHRVGSDLRKILAEGKPRQIISYLGARL